MGNFHYFLSIKNQDKYPADSYNKIFWLRVNGVYKTLKVFIWSVGSGEDRAEMFYFFQNPLTVPQRKNIPVLPTNYSLLLKKLSFTRFKI